MIGGSRKDRGDTPSKSTEIAFPGATALSGDYYYILFIKI
jgi:hypothetical protein